MKQKNASSTLYIIFFLVLFLAFSAFAVDAAIVFSNRIKLQNAAEITALTAASEFNSSSDLNIAKSNVLNTANNTFNILKKGGFEHAQINFQLTSSQILVTSHMVSEPFFLRFLGVSGINLKAKACAVSESLEVKAISSGVRWISSSAVYLSDILSKDLNVNDTAILMPLGKFIPASYDKSSEHVIFNLIEAKNDQPLSLGPGGFITIKLPVPIVDKSGADLKIYEAGDSKEGYMVFAGIDNNPLNPYVQYDKPGDGISWINITCSGKSIDNIANPTGTAITDNLFSQDKIYGSASFDIGDSCITGVQKSVSMAKYIRIIDDNEETAFVNYNGNYYKTMTYGEASSATPGADIDSVLVLNHVKLVKPGDF